MDHGRGTARARALGPLGVPRNLLRDAVFGRLLDAILRGEYRRGQRLRLDEIAADLGVSRTPVREALVPLESLRLVLVQRYVGVVIADWNAAHMVERLRLVRRLLADPPSRGAGPGTAPSAGPGPGPGAGLGPGTASGARSSRPPGASEADRFDAARARAAETEAGVACVLAEWALRRRGCPVSADLVATMHPLLDLVFSEDIARRLGFDATLDRGARLRTVERACSAALDDDVDGAVRATIGVIDALAALPGRFRAESAAS